MKNDGIVRVGLMKAAGLALAVSAGLAFSTQSGQLLRQALDIDVVRSIPYGRSALITLIDLSVLLTLLWLAGASGQTLAKLSGVFEPIGWPALFGLIVLGPAIALCAAVAPLAKDVLAADLAWKTFAGPFFEELGFRGIAVGVLMRLCGWPIAAACLWPALFFGAAHAWQGGDLQEVGGIVAITGLGGLFFGWLYVRWGFNLWPPVMLHVGLNGLWLLFDLGVNAIGGWFGNALRFGVIALAVGVTLWLAPKKAVAN